MPDIAMCRNPTCEKKNECWRYIAIPSQYQCYMEFQNICKNPTYKYFYPIDDKSIRKDDIDGGN